MDETREPAKPASSSEHGALSMREAAAKVADGKASYFKRFGPPGVGDAFCIDIANTLVSVASAIRALPIPPDPRDGEIAEMQAEVVQLRQALGGKFAFNEPAFAAAIIENGQLNATISALRSAVATAKEALEPFVKLSADGIAAADRDQKELHGFEDDDVVDRDLYCNMLEGVTYGNFRHARSALAAIDAAVKGEAV
jgi:hypothetical protein